MERESLGPGGRAALDFYTFAKESNFEQVPNSELKPALYKRSQKYRPFPEFRSVIKRLISQEPTEKQPDLLRLLLPEDFLWEKRAEAHVQKALAQAHKAELKAQTKAQTPLKAANVVIESVERAGLKEVLDRDKHSTLYQLFHKFLKDPIFQAEIKKHPEVLKVVEPIWTRKSYSASGLAALDLFNLAKEVAKDSNITELPVREPYLKVHNLAHYYRRYPEFQSTLKQLISHEPPEAQTRLQQLLMPKEKAPKPLEEPRVKLERTQEPSKAQPMGPPTPPAAVMAARAVVGSVERAGLTEVLDSKKHFALYQKFRRHQNDSVFQSEIKKHPHVWELIEPLLNTPVISPQKQAALDLFEYARNPNVTKRPSSTKANALYQRLRAYENDPDFQSALRQLISQEPPEEQPRILRIFKLEGLHD